jgi:XrtN system VIT domain protein
MDIQVEKSSKKLFYAGLILIFFELIILYLSGLNRINSFDFFDNSGLFLLNYVLTIIYFIVLFANKISSIYNLNKLDRKFFIILLTLFSISAFTLNNSIVIFSEFSTWAKYYLVIIYTGFACLVFFEHLPKAIKLLLFFVLGLCLVMMLYFVIYLAPTYPFAILGFFVLGLSLHLLVPLFFLTGLIFIFIKIEKTKFDSIAFVLGIVIPLIIVVIFLVRWDNFKSVIHEANSSIMTRPDNTLPEWVLLCQDIPSDSFTQKIVEGSLVYDYFNNMTNGFTDNVFDEVKRHDPLVNVGMGIMGDINLDSETRIKILKSQFNARHLTQRKLWSGRDLGTIEVLNDIKIYPEYRIAYTEKIITVKNFSKSRSDNQEAAYTFYLPEGSVATSLSLWINGKEEKSRLTSKSKADSAYTKIVGVERRDPALLHWQEGNTLTVTVFPCTPSENRRFKIGITTPLEKIGDKLKWKNVYFEGPVSDNILETSHIHFETNNEIKDLDLPNGFKNDLNNHYLYSGNFRPDWEFSFKSMPLSTNTFTFNNYSYKVAELNKDSRPIYFEAIYLDINSSWTKKEFESVYQFYPKIKLYAHHDKMIEINSNNKDKVFERLNKKRFSLFPFNAIKNIDNSIVISKSEELSPNLSDLEGSVFLDELFSNLSRNKNRINFFQLGNMSSPYIKTLKEFDIFNFSKGTIDKFEKYINNHNYIYSDSDSNQIDIDIANISIIRDSSQTNSSAPDHLLRLFAYSRIMKDIGKNYFNKDSSYINGVVAIANEAYLVSPVSSLIVLETVKDYDRFDIGENQNSLKNASVKSSGAVPEPSEWIMIILFVSLALFLFIRKKYY